MTAKALMFQGTGSDVGKSLMVAGLGRALTRRGLRVRPFKPQNMSNNAAVTEGGGEIGRAQALQARACGVEPTVDMNPVLLKPQSEVGAQVVVQGRICGNADARRYLSLKGELMPRVLASFGRIKAEADLVLVEGAGSPAEVNLRAGDIANMGFALAAGVPVVLIADIERGGSIASLVGTWALLESEERALVRGYIINKFRGDVSLFDDGLAVVGRRTGLVSFGVVPHLAAAARLPAEDAVALDAPTAEPDDRAVKVVVPKLSRIANFDDFDPLKAEPEVRVRFIPPGTALPGDADLVLLPGTKATIGDLAFFREQGWDIDLRAHLRRGGTVLGICGGYQMLGRRIADPDGVEGPPGVAEGLGLLDVETVLTGDKSLTKVTGEAFGGLGPIRGYEMHVGRTTGPDRDRALLRIGSETDGAISADGRVMGCYVHGLFAEDSFRRAFLKRFAGLAESGLAYEADMEKALDALADGMERALDMEALLAAAA